MTTAATAMAAAMAMVTRAGRGARAPGPGLRIAMVTTFYPPYHFGGDAIYVQRLARALVARGHHVEVIHDTDGYRAMTGTTPALPAPHPDDPVVHRLGSRNPRLASLSVQQLGRPTLHARRLHALLDGRFDVIHFHNVSLIGGPAIWKIGTGVKLHMAHEHWLVCPTHILWRDNREICDERRCLRCVLRHRRPPQLWRATDLIAREARHVDRFLTLSRSAAANHRAFGFGPEMTVFPSFLPKAEAAPASVAPGAVAAGGAPTRPYFLFVGRLEVIKGLQAVIPEFDAAMPADLLIAGDGAYEGTLRRLAEGRANVRFLGRQTMEELRHLYRGARAVLTPSNCYEVFPLVVLEAFRDSAPVIARDLGPYPEILAETGAGRLFRDRDELRAALLHYAGDAAAAARDGARGRAAFERQWSEDVVIAQYFRLIAAAADEKGLTATAGRALAEAGRTVPDPAAGRRPPPTCPLAGAAE